MKHKISLIILTLLPSIGFCETLADDTDLYEYHPFETDIYSEHKNANIIIDYYNTWGISTSERYNYHILIIDNIITLHFESPETADFNQISFETKRALKPDQLNDLNQVLKRSKLKQLKTGVPHPFFTGYAQEILIVKSKNLSIAGGMFYSTIEGDEVGIPIDQQIKNEKESNSSIGGDYEAVFKVLNNLFVEINHLLHKMNKFNSEPSTLITPTFSITITPKCKDGGGMINCNNVEYIGINRKNKKSIHLKGHDLFNSCPNDVGNGTESTPCDHIGYEFRNGTTIYLVDDDGNLTVKQNSKILIHEQGRWTSQP